MSNRRLLQLLFFGILVTMVVVTVRASMRESLWSAWPEYSANPWAIATLWDAYFGFLTFYLWVAWRERSARSRIVWLVLVMTLGNIATSLYMILALERVPPDGPLVQNLLARR